MDLNLAGKSVITRVRFRLPRPWLAELSYLELDRKRHDSGIGNGKLYRHMAATWSRDALALSGATPVLLSVADYRETTPSPAHLPAVENLENGLRAIHGALGAGRLGKDLPSNYAGVALFGDHTFTPQASFRDIDSGHELIAFNNYVLDRHKSTSVFRLWSFDPQNRDPLSYPAIQQATHLTIKPTSELAAVGDYLIEWSPRTLKYRVYRVDPKSADILVGPVSQGTLPAGISSASTLLRACISCRVPMTTLTRTRNPTIAAVESWPMTRLTTATARSMRFIGSRS